MILKGIFYITHIEGGETRERRQKQVKEGRENEFIITMSRY
jgi:hypothetical protein